MFFKRKHFYINLLIIQLHIFIGNAQNQIPATDIRDRIIELQCFAKCDSKKFTTNIETKLCREACQKDMIRQPRPGFCPSLPHMTHAAINNFATQMKMFSCADNCSYDYYCDDVQKCCDSSCGPVCKTPFGLSEDRSLPPIPKILKYKVRGHKVIISIQLDPNSTYLFHVESRFHIGIHHSPRKYGLWQWKQFSIVSKTFISHKQIKVDFEFNLKPGRWYVVRVAAINEYGFRGYSDVSEPIKLTLPPKPPKPPTDLKVMSANYNGFYCSVKIEWCPSVSNLPIEKYKIIWSLYVEGEAIISNESYVKDVQHFKISKLKPNSSYYIQVLAISVNGKRRLKSDIKSILYNTTLQTTPFTKPLKCGQKNGPREYYAKLKNNNYKHHNNNNNNLKYNSKINEILNNINDTKVKQITTTTTTTTTTSTSDRTAPAYDVRFRYNRKLGMIVQIFGFPVHKEKLYELCAKETNCEQEDWIRANRANKDSLEFSKLNYHTTYVLKTYKVISEILDPLAETNSFTFTTPKCENFRKRFQKAQIDC